MFTIIPHDVFRSQMSVAKTIEKQQHLLIEEVLSDGMKTLTRSLCYVLLSWSIVFRNVVSK